MTNSAEFSLVGATIFPPGGEGVLKVHSFVTNRGTTPISIVRVDWVLSEKDVHEDFDNKMARWVYELSPPLQVKGRETSSLEFSMPFREKNNADFDKAAEYFYTGLPDFIRKRFNISLDLKSTLLVYCVDFNGDLREIEIPMESFAFRGEMDETFAYSAPLLSLPKKVNLTDSGLVKEKTDFFTIWTPAMYYGGQRELVSRETLKAYGESAQGELDKFWSERRDSLKED